MHIILNPVGSHGDVHPFLGLGQTLMQRGHRVTLVTAAPFRSLAETAGFTFAPTGTLADYEAITHHPDLWHPTKSLQVLLGGDVPKRMFRTAYAAIEQAIAGDVAGSVVVSGSLGFAGRLAHEALGVRFATVHLQPGSLPSVVAPPVFPTLTVPRWWPHWLRRAMYYYAERHVIDPVLAPGVNELRGELGLKPIRRVFGPWRHSPQRILLAFPAWLAHAPDWPAHAVHTGFPHFDRASHETIDPALEQFLHAGSPPVVVSFGTAMRQAREPIATTIAACQQLGRRLVILAKSGEQVPQLLPTNVFHADYAPFSQVIPRSALLVHHGGIGTSAQGLRAGVPQLIRPMAFDQHDNANRLTRLNVARSVLVPRFQVATVTKVMRELLDSPAVAESCQRLAQQTASDPPGEGAMADAVEALIAESRNG